MADFRGSGWSGLGAVMHEYHANSYLIKPAEHGALSQLLDALGQYWLQWNRYPRLSLAQ